LEYSRSRPHMKQAGNQFNSQIANGAAADKSK